MKLLLIFVGAGTGGLVRHWLAALIQARHGATPPEFPYGTLLVNLSGCLAIGVLMFVTEQLASDTVRDNLRAALMVGLLGGFTTFSAFGKETLELMHAGLSGRAVVYVLASVVGGIAAVLVGWLVARTFA